MFCQSMYEKEGYRFQCDQEMGHDGPHHVWVFGGDTLIWECCCCYGNGHCGCKVLPSDEK